MDDDRTRGWLIATFDSRAYPMAFDVFLAIVAEAVMLLALAWMIRIWRGPTREALPVWRYRDGE